MTILVTGGAGFIGSHVVDALLERGDEVISIDDLNDYYDPKLKQQNADRHKKHPKYRFIKLDIRDKDAVSKLFKEHKITSVIHLAARAGVRPSLEDPELYITTNVLGTLNLLENSKHVKNFVYASSSSVYGNSNEAPFKETHQVDQQVSPYAVSKKAGESLCHYFSNIQHIPVTCLRFFTVYGPRGRPDMAPFLFIDAVHNGKHITVYGDGSTARDYTYVEDIVKGVLAAHDRPQGFAIYNLGNNHPVTLSEFVRTVEEVVGKQADRISKPMQPGDVDRTWADINKASEELGYRPKTSLRDGLKMTYAWYKAAREDKE